MQVNANAASSLSNAELGEAVRRRIDHRTNRRIESLEVDVVANQIVIGGRASSYHVKQLGVLDVLGLRGDMRVRLGIKVATSPVKPRFDLGRA